MKLIKKARKIIGLAFILFGYIVGPLFMISVIINLPYGEEGFFEFIADGYIIDWIWNSGFSFGSLLLGNFISGYDSHFPKYDCLWKNIVGWIVYVIVFPYVHFGIGVFTLIKKLISFVANLFGISKALFAESSPSSYGVVSFKDHVGVGPYALRTAVQEICGSFNKKHRDDRFGWDHLQVVRTVDCEIDLNKGEIIFNVLSRYQHIERPYENDLKILEMISRCIERDFNNYDDVLYKELIYPLNDRMPEIRKESQGIPEGVYIKFHHEAEKHDFYAE